MIYILLPVLPTPAVEKTDVLLKVKGADGWGSLTGGWGSSLSAGPIVNGSVVNGRANDSFAFIFALGCN